MTLPLSGVRVLDLTRLLPGAVCTLMLADMGADVVKIESLDGGDYARALTPEYFAASNRNKRSIALNLKHVDGVAAFKRLVEKADVVVESYRPGVMARLGCDYLVLRALNPRLVYCAMSGYGQTGPSADASGHDMNYVAQSGVLGAMSNPQALGAQVADVGGAYAAVAGILAALLRRSTTNIGGMVDIALLDSVIPFAAYQWAEALKMRAVEPSAPTDANTVKQTGPLGSLPSGIGGMGSLTGGLACYHVYRARDGQPVALAALEHKFWSNFCNTIDRPDLIPDYLLPERQRYLRGEVGDIFVRRSAQDWYDLLYDADCCFSLVASPAQLADDPQLKARRMLGQETDGTPWFSSPIRLDGDRTVRTSAPNWGVHTSVILSEVAYSTSEIEAMMTMGAVGGL
jgi:alpha-methylacyl-CoA racemase